MASLFFRRGTPLKPTLGIHRSLSLPSSSNADPNDVVSSAASILINYRSKSRWATLLSHFPQGFTPLQVSLILLRVRSNPNLAAAFFRFTSENALTCHDLRSFSTIIHIVARARKRSRAHTLIRTAIRSSDPDGDTPELFRALTQTYRSCDSTPLVFDVLILAYLELNRIDSCLQMVRLLKLGGFKLELKTCNALVSRVAKLRGVRSGFDLYRELFGVLDDYDGGGGSGSGRGRVRPNAATFNGMLMVCFREGLCDMAEEIWMEMQRLRCDPNSTSYHILMAAYCEEGELEKAVGLWEEMKSKGLRRDIVAYNTLIGGWCKVGKVETGEDLYREMEMGGIEGTVVTYQHLINGHCKAGDVTSASLLFKEIRRKGFTPDVVIVDLLVGELCKVGMVSEGLEVFRHMTQQANFGARRSSYEFLIKGLCGNGEMEEALKLQAEMVGKGFEPDYDVYAAFVDGYIKLGQTDVAEKLREEMNQNLLLKGD